MGGRYQPRSDIRTQAGIHDSRSEFTRKQAWKLARDHLLPLNRWDVSPLSDVMFREFVERHFFPYFLPTLTHDGSALDANLTPEIALEVCRRTSRAALLDGSISQIGLQYLLTLKATNCSSGESLAFRRPSPTGDQGQVHSSGWRGRSELP